MVNYNNTMFEFILSGNCEVMSSLSGHPIKRRETCIVFEKLYNIIAYQTWDANTIVENNHIRRVFSINPHMFKLIVDKFNSDNNEYKPSCVFRTPEKDYFVVVKKFEVLNSFQSRNSKNVASINDFSIGKIKLIIENNFTDITSNYHAKNTPHIPPGVYTDVDLNFSSVSYDDLEYYGDDREFTPFGNLANFDVPHKFDLTNEPVKPPHKNSFLNALDAPTFNSVPTDKSYNFIIREKCDVVPVSKDTYEVRIKSNKSFITAYEDWTKNSLSSYEHKRIIRDLCPSQFMKLVSSYNHRNKITEFDKLTKFTPTTFLEVDGKPYIGVITDMRISHSTDASMDKELVLRFNTWQMQSFTGRKLQYPSPTTDARLYMNIDSTPTGISSSVLYNNLLVKLGMTALTFLEEAGVADTNRLFGFYSLISYVNIPNDKIDPGLLAYFNYARENQLSLRPVNTNKGVGSKPKQPNQPKQPNRISRSAREGLTMISNMQKKLGIEREDYHNVIRKPSRAKGSSNGRRSKRVTYAKDKKDVTIFGSFLDPFEAAAIMGYALLHMSYYLSFNRGMRFSINETSNDLSEDPFSYLTSADNQNLKNERDSIINNLQQMVMNRNHKYNYSKQQLGNMANGAFFMCDLAFTFLNMLVNKDIQFISLNNYFVASFYPKRSKGSLNVRSKGGGFVSSGLSKIGRGLRLTRPSDYVRPGSIADAARRGGSMSHASHNGGDYEVVARSGNGIYEPVSNNVPTNEPLYVVPFEEAIALQNNPPPEPEITTSIGMRSNTVNSFDSGVGGSPQRAPSDTWRSQSSFDLTGESVVDNADDRAEDFESLGPDGRPTAPIEPDYVLVDVNGTSVIPNSSAGDFVDVGPGSNLDQYLRNNPLQPDGKAPVELTGPNGVSLGGFRVEPPDVLRTSIEGWASQLSGSISAINENGLEYYRNKGLISDDFLDDLISKENIERAVDEMVKNGELNRSDGLPDKKTDIQKIVDNINDILNRSDFRKDLKDAEKGGDISEGTLLNKINGLEGIFNGISNAYNIDLDKFYERLVSEPIINSYVESGFISANNVRIILNDLAANFTPGQGSNIDIVNRVTELLEKGVMESADGRYKIDFSDKVAEVVDVINTTIVSELAKAFNTQNFLNELDGEGIDFIDLSTMKMSDIQKVAKLSIENMNLESTIYDRLLELSGVNPGTAPDFPELRALTNNISGSAKSTLKNIIVDNNPSILNDVLSNMETDYKDFIDNNKPDLTKKDLAEKPNFNTEGMVDAEIKQLVDTYFDAYFDGQLGEFHRIQLIQKVGDGFADFFMNQANGPEALNDFYDQVYKLTKLETELQRAVDGDTLSSRDLYKIFDTTVNTMENLYFKSLPTQSEFQEMITNKIIEMINNPEIIAEGDNLMSLQDFYTKYKGEIMDSVRIDFNNKFAENFEGEALKTIEMVERNSEYSDFLEDGMKFKGELDEIVETFNEVVVELGNKIVEGELDPFRMEIGEPIP